MGRRAVSAAGLKGLGSRKRMRLFQTPASTEARIRTGGPNRAITRTANLQSKICSVFFWTFDSTWELESMHTFYKMTVELLVFPKV